MLEVYYLSKSPEKGGIVKLKKISKIENLFVNLVNPSDKEFEDISEKLKIPLFVLYKCKEDFRPKLEIFENFVVLNFKIPRKDPQEFSASQITLFFGKDFLVCVHAGSEEVDKIIERVVKSEDKKLSSELDYLFYSILDSIIEKFYALFEKMDEEIDVIEYSVFTKPSPESLQHIFNLKRYALQLHKVLWAEREAIYELYKGVPGIRKGNVMYFRDLYDHLIQLIDADEVVRDVLSNALESYLSIVSNKMNEIIKVLTFIATVMMPPTLIASIYGMNFKYMPELYWHYGYLFALVLMIFVGVLLWMFLKKKGWV